MRWTGAPTSRGFARRLREEAESSCQRAWRCRRERRGEGRWRSPPVASVRLCCDHQVPKLTTSYGINMGGANTPARSRLLQESLIAPANLETACHIRTQREFAGHGRSGRAREAGRRSSGLMREVQTQSSDSSAGQVKSIQPLPRNNCRHDKTHDRPWLCRAAAGLSVARRRQSAATASLPPARSFSPADRRRVRRSCRVSTPRRDWPAS